jgi:hypothetical protein
MPSSRPMTPRLETLAVATVGLNPSVFPALEVWRVEAPTGSCEEWSRSGRH